MPPLLQPGAAAPAFELSNHQGAIVTLAGLRGKPVVLAFYPADWSPVCGDQMALYNEILPEFQRFRRRDPRHLGRRRLVPRGVRARTASCIFRCWRTSSPRARWRAATARTASRTAQPNARCS